MISKCIETKGYTQIYTLHILNVTQCLITFHFAVVLKNLALEGTATTSSANRKHNAYKAIDGNAKRILYGDSCIFTSRRKRIWLRVDFLKPIEVYGVEITPGKMEMLHKYIKVSYENVNKEHIQCIK